MNVADPVSRCPNLLAVVSAVTTGDWRESNPPSPNVARSQPTDSGDAAGGSAPVAKSLLDRCRDGYAADIHFASDVVKTDPAVKQQGNLFLHNGAVMVPADNTLRDAVVYEAHDAAASGHGSEKATLLRLKGRFHWSHGDSNMADHVRDHVRTCDACQRNKPSNRKPGGLLQPMPVPARPWSSISVGFITGLPETLRGHDAIFVCVDCFVKMVHFIATRKGLSAHEYALLMFNNIFKLHGLPDDIVSDRDKLFTSEF